MSFFQKLFGSRGKGPPADEHKAIAFVDYEHWYYGFRNIFHMDPDPVSWRKELDEHYSMEEIMIFGDFSNDRITDGLNKLRAISNTVISTQQPHDRHKKDMTDFIMLDYIYQVSAERNDVGTYILFTGDGHFQSVVKYLIQKLGKKVVVYGVSKSVSTRLKDVATEVHEIPLAAEVTKDRYQMIADNMAYVTTRNNIYPSFRGTVEAVARYNDVPEEEIATALREMLDKGLLVQKERRVDFNRKIKVITANWEALIAEGLWDPHNR